jgi:hypothetical protein
MYYIYENWQAGPHKAVLHHAMCGFCKDGRGLGGGSDPRHGKWHGPFFDLPAGRDAQEGLRVDVRIQCRCVK